jgi:hypothetical protein
VEVEPYGDTITENVPSVPVCQIRQQRAICAHGVVAKLLLPPFYYLVRDVRRDFFEWTPLRGFRELVRDSFARAFRVCAGLCPRVDNFFRRAEAGAFFR